MGKDPYEILGVEKSAQLEEIKAAYRILVKKHHPDIGGNKTKILEINAAWQHLKSIENRFINKTQEQQKTKANNADFKHPENKGLDKDKAISSWLINVYNPIDRLIAEIINPFPKKIRDLSADPYDDKLMEIFCEYIKRSQKKIEKIQKLYQVIPSPIQISHFSLSLYQCFAEVEDGINELERYTAGYVESYLHDGNEMLRKAKKKRLFLHQERKQLKF